MPSTTPVARRSLPWLLAALSMIGPFSIDAVFPAFPLLGAHFNVDAPALQQLISVYLITYAVMSLFHGAISDAIGRKPVIVAGMLVYALASAGAALSTTYPMLLLCRGLQGVCAGAGLVVGRAVIRDTYAGPAAQRLMSQVMMIFGIAPVIAPMVGAQLLLVGGWHGIFWLLTIASVVLARATRRRSARGLRRDLCWPAMCRSGAIACFGHCWFPARSTLPGCSCISPRRRRSCAACWVCPRRAFRGCFCRWWLA